MTKIEEIREELKKGNYVDTDVKLLTDSKIEVQGSYHKVRTVFLQGDINDIGLCFVGYAFNDEGEYNHQPLEPEEIKGVDLTPYMEGWMIKDIEGIFRKHPEIF